MVLLLLTIQKGYADTTGTNSDSVPKLQHLSSGTRTPSFDSTRIYSLDSADITSPAPRLVLSGSTTMVTVTPRINVDSVTIFVRHSSSITDTVAHLSTPPYSATWNYGDLQDQDQIHLQFGYLLHTTQGKTIISKALPHNWTINRKRIKRHKTYHGKQILPPDTVIIDGKLNEWKKTHFSKLGSIGSFAFKWTNASLYFAARIQDDSITSSDFTELHLDPFKTRSALSDSIHRSIRFGPASRSYSFVAHHAKNSATFTQCDSIAALLNEGILWRSVITDSGYTIEAALPFYALSNSDFPNLSSGMDVTCKTGSDHRGTFVSWSGSGEFERYTPGNWGTLALHQAMLPLKVVMFVGAVLFIIICMVMVTVIVYRFIYSERIESKEFKGGSELLSGIELCVDTLISDKYITVETVAKKLKHPVATVLSTLDDELDCTFTQFIDSRRIYRAKNDLWNFSLCIETVASNAGYQSVADMEQKFSYYLHTDPARYRMQATEMATDESDTERTASPPPPEPALTINAEIPS